MKVIVGANIAENQFYGYTINMEAKLSTLYNSINFVQTDIANRFCILFPFSEFLIYSLFYILNVYC